MNSFKYVLNSDPLLVVVDIMTAFDTNAVTFSFIPFATVKVEKSHAMLLVVAGIVVFSVVTVVSPPVVKSAIVVDVSIVTGPSNTLEKIGSLYIR